MDPAVQAAFVAVVRRQDERKEGVALLKRQDEHTAMRMVEKKAEKERKEAAAVWDAIYFYHMDVRRLSQHWTHYCAGKRADRQRSSCC